MKLSLTSLVAILWLSLLLVSDSITAHNFPVYRSETNCIYCMVAGNQLNLNAFLPASAAAPVPAIVEIHGGWWFGGGAASTVEDVGGWQIFIRRGLAIFSIQYRLAAC